MRRSTALRLNGRPVDGASRGSPASPASSQIQETKDGYSRCQQWSTPFLAALADAVDVWPGTEMDVGHGQTDQLADPQPGLDHRGEHGVVAASGAGGLVAGCQQGVGFGLVEVGDQMRSSRASGTPGPVGRPRRVRDVAARRSREQGVDRREPGVAGPYRVATNLLQVGQEPGDAGRV